MLSFARLTFANLSQIFRSAVKLCGVMSDLDRKLSVATTGPITGHTLLRVIRPETQWLVAFDDGHVLGEINASLEQVLNSITEQQYTLDYEVFAPIRAIRETITRATKEKDAIVRVQISIYGLRSIAQHIGKELSKMRIYLQRPDFVRDGAEYDNPHELKLVPRQHDGLEVVIQAEDVSSEKVASETLKQTIADVYSSLTRDKNLQGLEGDERLKTRLLP
jgi:SWI/SNF-related matrix-associated actin-dependent regulator of chromatin subfamily A3